MPNTVDHEHFRFVSALGDQSFVKCFRVIGLNGYIVRAMNECEWPRNWGPV